MSNVGFIGLGQMGGPMARNVIKAGHTVAVYDASPEALDAFRDTNAKRAASPRDAADGAGAVVTCLPTSADVHTAVMGPDGAAEGMTPGAVVIDTTTANPTESMKTAQALAERGFRMVDAALARPPWDAEAGTMVFLVGGSDEDVALAQPVLESMGTELIRCGPQGAGTTVKAPCGRRRSSSPDIACSGGPLSESASPFCSLCVAQNVDCSYDRASAQVGAIADTPRATSVSKKSARCEIW